MTVKVLLPRDELREDSVVRNFRTTAADGKQYKTNFYNLDATISVGYRVNSLRATQFRQWATQVLREFAIKGYVLDKKRLENGSFLGVDYFERVLQEIREIRLSGNDGRRTLPMTIEDWAKRLDLFLEFADKDILHDSGKVTAKIAKEFAES